jgi:predicted secreted protein
MLGRFAGSRVETLSFVPESRLAGMDDPCFEQALLKLLLFVGSLAFVRQLCFASARIGTMQFE